MNFLTKEQILNLRLNIYTNIWTTGFIQLDLDETYNSPFGLLCCSPGSGWYIKGAFQSENSNLGINSMRLRYPLDEFLRDHNIKYAVDCPIIKKLHKRRTHGIIFKLLGFPNNIKCWL